jgi:tetratricopeptide (TPR) repeat protein
VSGPLILLGDDAASERYLLAAHERFPDAPRLEMQLAWLDILRGRDTAALARARRLTAANPGDAEPPTILVHLAIMTNAADAESLLVPLYRQEPGGTGWILWETYRTLYGLLLDRRGERDSARALWQEARIAAEQAIARGNEAYGPRIEIAAIHAVEGDTAAALEWLDRAFQAGCREIRGVGRDPFFEGVRATPRFREILANAQTDVDAMRQRVRQVHPELFSVR